ncbi:MAG TPA: hypothetical protein VFA98_08380, partial [Thermoanaerobaculia bacterium]|nr:hypothetical protein [Thermoanaerobaculia bacterium]
MSRSLLPDLLRVAVALVAATAAGACVSRAWTRGLSRRERLGWSVAAGLLVQAAVLLALLAFRARPDAVRILLGEAAVALTGVAFSRSRGAAALAPRPASNRERTAIVLLAALAAAAWLLFLV